ncbi:multiple epidermal growth factor-like domains protein 10 [Saccostrea cucullata]|uniref:multiple epidermal growth factor-like domains protein 10 n=1 Tax=Saccostrea cuccullata TaxID=36930 RepID=UPI002ED12F0F
MNYTKKLTAYVTWSRTCTLFIMTFLLRYTRTQLCGNGCCAGYMWNKELKRCIACDIGYYGENCSSACPFPRFGESCQHSCNCSKNDCNFKHGCKMLLEDCDSGFTGLYCDIPCRYPSYGYACQKTCNCEIRFCNFSSGCEVGSPTVEFPSPSPTKKTAVTIVSSTTGCDNGFVGLYCNIPCRYPSYGYSCQESCNCEQKFCNFTTGCEAGSPTIEQPSPSPTEKSTLTVLLSSSDVLEDTQHLCQNNTYFHYWIMQKKRNLLIFGIAFLMSMSVLMMVIYLFINIKGSRSYSGARIHRSTMIRQRIILTLLKSTFALGLILTAETKKCMSNYTTCNRWNETFNTCEECECMDGYTGSQCEIPCPYPGYGKDCQKFCNCKQQYCIHITGCKDGSATLWPPETTKKHNLLPSKTFTDGCLHGYTGPDCKLQCRYPSFGVNCQEECDCQEEYCNFITGCYSYVNITKTECDHRERRKRRTYLLYSSITIGVIAVVQFSGYLYLSFFYKPVVFVINRY